MQTKAGCNKATACKATYDFYYHPTTKSPVTSQVQPNFLISVGTHEHGHGTKVGYVLHTASFLQQPKKSYRLPFTYNRHAQSLCAASIHCFALPSKPPAQMYLL
jgi:hypothetical protein